MIRWSARARSDLLEVTAYIGQDSPAAAARWGEGVEQRFALAGRNPMAGRVVPELGEPNLRELIHGRYRLMYRVRGRDLPILRIWEGHRLLRRADVTSADE